jgi:hypothetical protein
MIFKLYNSENFKFKDNGVYLHKGLFVDIKDKRKVLMYYNFLDCSGYILNLNYSGLESSKYYKLLNKYKN